MLKSTIESRELKTVGFFILQHAKLRMLELHCNFFHKYCDENKFEELATDTDSLYKTFTKKYLVDFILPDKKAQWMQICQNECRDDFIANAETYACCDAHKNHYNGSRLT